MAITMAAYLTIGIHGVGYMYYVLRVPIACFPILMIAAGDSCTVWRWGPAIAHHMLYQPAMVLITLCMVPTLYAGCLGPEATVPWHDRFHFV